MGGSFDSGFSIGDEGGKTIHFFGEPADFWVAIIAAAGLFGAVAAKKCPILRAPVIEPKAIFASDFGAQLFENWIWPHAVFVGNAGEIGEVAGADFARERGGDEGLAARGQLQAVGRQ